MKRKDQKKYCSKCKLHWTYGAKDGKHDNWCCNFGGKPAKDIFNHCVNVNGRQLIDVINIKAGE